MNKAPESIKLEETTKKAPIKLDSLIAAGGTATGSLLLWIVTQVMGMESAMQKLAATQNVLVDEDGLIRPSTTAIRAEIQLQELYSRVDRLERTLVKGQN